MKRFLFLLVMLAMLVPWAANAQQTITIGTGTSTTSNTPYNSLWGYSFVEQVYTAAEIGMTGNITSISFNNSSSGQTTNITVYMKLVTRTNFSSTTDFETVTAADIVYTGSHTFSQGWSTITLSTPFFYDGTSNLMIAIHEYTSGYTTQYFYYTTATQSAISFHSDSSNPDPYSLGSYGGNKYTSNNRANIKIDIVPGAITCHAVGTPTVSNLTATNATITWGTPEDGGSYILQYKTSTDTWDGSNVTEITTTDTTVDFNDGLTPMTTYDVRIANLCSGNDTSYWRNLFFTTACADITTLPHTENFDTYNTGTSAYPTCWTRFNTYTSGTYPYVNSTNYEGTGSLYFYTGTSGTYNMAIMNAIDQSFPLNTLQATFAYRGSNSTDRLIVGVIEDISDPTTFIPVDTVYPQYGTVSAWDIRTVSFADYEGTGSNIAFKNEYTTTSCYAYIDNLTIDLISDCNTPSNVTTYNYTATGATINWTPGGNESSWEVVVVPANADVNTGTPELVYEHPYTFTTLSDGTTYDVYVRAVCDGGDNSSWSTKRTFTTHPNCSAPIQVQVAQLAGQSALITWQSANFGATGYTVGWSEAGQDNWTTQTTTGTEFMISGLTPTTDYDAFVFSNCALGDPDTITLEFTTKCLAGGSVEIGTGTSTTYYTPSYSYYKNSYSQQIYLADEMNGASDITSVSFDMSTCNLPSRYWKVYLMHTAQTSTSSWLDATTAQLVFKDTVSLHTGWNTVNFSTPFAYNGTDNLVLIVIDSSSTSGSYNYYRYTTAGSTSAYRARYYYSNTTTFSTASTPSSGTNSTSRVNVIFGAPCDSTVTCIAPNPYVTTVTDNSVTVAWAPGSTETSWELEYTTDSAYISEGSVTSPYTITGLTDNTEVTIRVRSICGGSDNSEWAEVEASTACSAATLPLTEDFESSASGSSNMVDCWTARSNYSSTNNHYYPYVSTTYHHDAGTKSAYFYGTSAYYSILASPEFDADVNMSNLQVRFWAYKTTASYYIQVGVMTDPNDANTFVQVGNNLTPSNTSEWQMMAVNTDDYTGNGRYIAFRVPEGYANYMYIDDIVIDEIPSCAYVDSLSVSDVGMMEATINWIETGGASSWDLAIVPGTGDVDLDTVSIISVSGAPGYTVSGLEMNTAYTAYVRANCGSDGYSIWMSTVFMTAQTPATLPFFCDFENADEAAAFAIVNGTQTNKWVVGTATSHGGTHALYISDDNGSSNNYSATASTVWAYRDIEFPASPSGYELSFDWRCNGESSYDFMNVYVGTPGYVAAGVPSSLSSGNTAAPAGTIVINGNGNTTYPQYFNLKTDYQSFTTNLPGLEETTVQRIYFLWRNDGSVQNQPPIAVDNISIAAINCDAPTAVTVSNITAYTADVTWTTDATSSVLSYKGENDADWTEIDPASSPETLTNLLPNTTYTVRVANHCDGNADISPYVTTSFTTECAPMTMANLPYTQNFDGVTGSTSTSVSINNLPSCWDYYNTCTNSDYTGYPMVYSSTSYSHSGSNSMRYYPYYGTQIAILPELDVTDVTISDLRISFYGRCGSTSYPLQVIVGVMSNPDSISTFVPTDTVSVNTATHTHYYGQLAGYTGTGAFVALRVNETSSSSYYGYLDDIVLSEAPHCAAPANLTANFTTDGVTLNWDEIDGESNFQAYLYPSNQTPDYTQAEQVTTNSYSDQSLESGVSYTFMVRTICSNGQGYSDWAIITFTTMTVDPATVPYAHDFDDGMENAAWTLLNGSLTNKWYIGKPSTEADSVLFISNDGTSESYTISSSSNVWAYRDFNFGNGAEFNIDLKWKAQGESCCDYLRVFIGTPNDVAASTSISEPAGAVQLVEKLNQQTSWQHFNVTLNSSYANTTQRLYLLWHNDGSVGTDPAAVIDSITITVNNCGTPYNVAASNVDFQSADIAFTPAMDGDGAWEYVYGEYPFAPSDTMSETPQPISASTFTLSGLAASSHYTVYVRTSCGGGDYSSWSEGVSFFTPCTAASIPYSENFDSYSPTATSTSALASYPNDILPNCWTFLNRSTTSSTYPQAFLTSSTTYAASGKCLFFKSSSTTPLYAILPEFTDPLQGLQITFKYRNEGTTTSNGTLSLGYMTDIADMSTFTEIATYPMTTTITEISEVLSVIPSSVTNATLVFKYTGGTSNNYYLSIDNVLVEPIPSCPKPNGLTATASTTTSITLGWSANGSSASNWNIEYGPAGFEQGTGTTVQTTTNPHTINGLNPSTAYDFYVQGDCGGGDTSHWSNVFSASTDCGIVSALPYSENFESYGASSGSPVYYPTCWAKINTYSSGDRPYISTTHYGTGIGSLYFYAGTSGTYNIAITPEFDASIDISTLKATFMYRANGNNDRLIVGVMSSTTDATTFVPVDTVFPTQGSASTWVEKEVSFSNYTGNGQFIAFKNEYTTTSAYAYMDNLVIDLEDSTIVDQCDKPTALAVSNITTNSATATWTAGGSETAWNVQYKAASASNWTDATANTASFTMNGLTANTPYQVRVQANCGNGSTSLWTSAVTFTTLDQGVEPCDVPTGLTASDITGESIVISWDNNANVSSWNIQYRPQGGQLSTASSNTNSYTITGLTSNTTYQIQVQANCSDGNLSDWSPAINVTTTGIENWLENSVTLYPNPAKEYVDIRVDGDLNVSMMEVYDVYGKLINAMNVIENPTRINVSGLANGMYFVRVTTEAGMVTKTFVKK